MDLGRCFALDRIIRAYSVGILIRLRGHAGSRVGSDPSSIFFALATAPDRTRGDLDFGSNKDNRNGQIL
jgi:hypothetical protein